MSGLKATARDLTAEAVAARNLYVRARRAWLATMAPGAATRHTHDAKAQLHAAARLVNQTRLGLRGLAVAVVLWAVTAAPAVRAEPGPSGPEQTQTFMRAPYRLPLSLNCPNGTVSRVYTELPAPAGERRGVLVCVVPATHPVNNYHYRVRVESGKCAGTVTVCEGGDCWIQVATFECPSR